MNKMSNKELIEKCREAMKELIRTAGKSWTLHSPARNTDSDMLFSELIDRFEKAIEPEPAFCYSEDEINLNFDYPKNFNGLDRDKREAPKFNDYIEAPNMEKNFEWTDELVKDFIDLISIQRRKTDIESDMAFFKRNKAEHSTVTKYPEGIESFSNPKTGTIYPVAPCGLAYHVFVRGNIRDGYAIHSVKNSAGEVLTVGDKTTHGTIKGFRARIAEKGYASDILADCYNGGGIYINMVHPVPPSSIHRHTHTSRNGISFTIESDYDIEWVSIVNDLEDISHKIKPTHPLKDQPLLTQDGHLIKDREIFYSVTDDFEIVDSNGLSFKKDDIRLKRTFRFRENASKYIWDNKPLFSKKQILDAISEFEKQDNIVMVAQTGIFFKSKLQL